MVCPSCSAVQQLWKGYVTPPFPPSANESYTRNEDVTFQLVTLIVTSKHSDKLGSFQNATMASSVLRKQWHPVVRLSTSEVLDLTQKYSGQHIPFRSMLTGCLIVGGKTKHIGTGKCGDTYEDL